MKLKVLSFVWLLCAGFLSAQETLVNYQFNNNLNPDAGAIGSPTLTYHANGGAVKTPSYSNDMLRTTDEGDYLELTIDTTGKEGLILSFYGDFSALAITGSWDVTANTGPGGNFQNIGSLDLFSIFWITIGGTFSANLPASAENNPNLIIRIKSDFTAIGGTLRLDNLKLTAGSPKIRVYSNTNEYIPHESEASVLYNTDFGTLMTSAPAVTHTFRIRNYQGDSGSKLAVNSIVTGGANPDDFTVTFTPFDNLPPTNSNSSNSTYYRTFNITFSPTADGVRTAEVYVYSNAAPNPYIFTVIGTGASCNLTSTTYANNNFTFNQQQSLTGNYTAGDLIAGSAKTNTLNIQLYPYSAATGGWFPQPENNPNLYTSSSTSWYVRNTSKTVEFGPIDISSQKNVQIRFNVAAFATANNRGVTSDDFVTLSVMKPDNSWSGEMRLKGSNNTSNYIKYDFSGGSIFSKTYTGNNSNSEVTNTITDKYKTFVLSIPASANISDLNFRITANTNRDNRLWLIDDVQVLTSNSVYKTFTTGNVWVPSPPTQYEKAVIEGNYTNSGNPTVCECEVMAGGSLTIPTGTSVTVRGKVINHGDGDNIVVKHDANLIQIENDAVNIGEITVEKNFNFSSQRKQYNYVTAPVVANRNIKETIYMPNPTSVQEYNTGNDYFYETPGPYESGKAYAVKEPASGNDTGEFMGVPFNGVLNYPLNTSGNRYNLLGNPYPSNLDILLLYNFNNTKFANADFYFWDNRNNTEFTQQGSGYSGVQYAMYNAVSNIGNPAPTNNQPGNERIPDRYVKVGTGFIIQASNTGGTLDFNNSYRTSEGDIGFFGKGFAPESQSDRYWLSMDTPGGIRISNAVVYFEGGNDAFAIDDTESFLGSDDLFTFTGEKAVAIQGKAPFHNDDKIQLGYKAFNEGTHIISVFKAEGIFAEEQNIYLVDKLLHKTVNLSVKPYKFLTRAGQFNDRFEIIYKNKNIFSTVQDTVEPLLITVTRQSDDLLIMSKGDNLSEVTVYNLLGKPVFTYKDLNTEELRIPAAEYLKQILIVNIVTQSGRTASQKVIPK